MLVFVLFFLMSFGAFGAEHGILAWPEGEDISSFPIESGPLSPDRQKELGLHEAELREWVYTPTLNWHRDLEGGRFVLERLSYDTKVLSDKDNIPRYKKDCGNRLIFLPRKEWQKPVGDLLLPTTKTNTPWWHSLLFPAGFIFGLLVGWLVAKASTTHPTSANTPRGVAVLPL